MKLWRTAVLATGLGLGGCTQTSGSTDAGSTAPPKYQMSQGLHACVGATLEDGVPLQPGQRCFTYRALGGVSMGGGSSSRIGFHYPELFDAIGVMGTPFSDFDYFYNMLATNHLGGFCSREQLLALMEANPGNPDILNQAEAFCGQHGADIPGELAVPDSQCYLFRSDFNHWYRGPDEGRGGGFTRPHLFEIIQDITATYGNSGYYNPDSPYLPPGVPLSERVPPNATDAEKAAQRASMCANPTVLTNFRNAQWNPDGSFPVITFCDCNNCQGDYNGDRDMPTEVLLAVDYNRNNRRDYGEPIIWTPQEPFRDVGLDGKETGENGDDPTDEYDALNHATGLAHNHRFDDGEPYDDVGLDGLPGTGDYGEDDGKFTYTPAMERALNDSPTRWYNRMSDTMANRLDIWMDAGIRDFINSAQITNNLFGAIKARIPDTRLYRDFAGLGNLPVSGTYLFTNVDFSASAMGRNAYLLYGDPAICPGSDAEDGNGNHVGPGNVVIQRLLSLFAFVDARMPGGDRTYINAPSAADDTGGDFSQHLRLETYPSTALGRPQNYGLVLPPGYFYPENNNKTYPVIYFLHGQGQNAADMVALGAIFMGYMYQSANGMDKSDMQKFILVFADGDCLREFGECHTGNFYSNFVGSTGNGPQFETAFLELMRHVDGTFRTKKPEVH